MHNFKLKLLLSSSNISIPDHYLFIKVSARFKLTLLSYRKDLNIVSRNIAAGDASQLKSCFSSSSMHLIIIENDLLVLVLFVFKFCTQLNHIAYESPGRSNSS